MEIADKLAFAASLVAELSKPTRLSAKEVAAGDFQPG